MERRGIQAEIKEISKEISRLDKQHTAVLSRPYDDSIPALIEKILDKRQELRKRLGELRKIEVHYGIVLDCIRFAESDWCQFLLLGNKLTPNDIIHEWTKEAEKIWEETGGKKIHPGYKITEETIRQILALYDSGMKRKDIAKRLGISTYPVNRYIRERSHE